MKILLFCAAMVAAISFWVLPPGVALAQEATSTIRVGDILAPWADMIVSAVSILIAAVITYVANLIRTKTGIDIEAKHRDALQAALTNGAGLILSKLGGSLADKTIDVKSPLIAEGIEYVLKAAPDAVNKFGLAPSDLAEKLVAKLGLASAAVSTTTAAPAGAA